LKLLGYGRQVVYLNADLIASGRRRVLEQIDTDGNAGDLELKKHACLFINEGQPEQFQIESFGPV
jgi:hypothetical protein